MTCPAPRSIAIYRRGPAWAAGTRMADQPSLLDHGRFLQKLEQTGLAVHAGPNHRLDEVPPRDPIGMASFPCGARETGDLLRDDPGLVTGLLTVEILAWHVSGAGETA